MMLAGPTYAGSLSRACSIKEYCGMGTGSFDYIRLRSVL